MRELWPNTRSDGNQPAMGQEKLPGLQVARAIAALSIAYFHSWHVSRPFPPGTSYPIPLLSNYGWVAVDFFFAISGFVICLVVSRSNFNPLQFIVRRAFRLYPLWIATSLIYLWLTNFLGRSAIQTDAFFAYSLTLLPTEGYPFYDLGGACSMSLRSTLWQPSSPRASACRASLHF
jgi:exopolysaccharide production protein ExoZ